jgi:hypothetical protein
LGYGRSIDQWPDTSAPGLIFAVSFINPGSVLFI